VDRNENILVPDINATSYSRQKLCHDLANQFWSQSKKADNEASSPTCQPGTSHKIVTSSQPTSMTNYNWHHTDNVLELGIGVSCCPKPTEEMLSSIWARTRPGLIGLLNSLQGIHVFVSNINGQKAQVTIKELGNDVKLYVDQYGHMWHLLAKGSYTITVSVEGYLPMTKFVHVVNAAFNEVDFNLPYAPGLPRAITALALSSFILCILLCSLLVHCRQNGRGKKSSNRSYEGFQLLNREERHVFEDEDDFEEEEVEIFDKSVEQFGLKMPPAQVYRDITSSSEEDAEDAFLKVRRAQPEKWKL